MTNEINLTGDIEVPRKRVPKNWKAYDEPVLTKLENALATAIAIGDQQAEQKLTKAIETLINRTDFPKVSA